MEIDKIRKLVELKLEMNLSTPSRKRELVYGRAIYFKLCKDLTRTSLEQVGKSVNRDHASVIHGLKLFDDIICRGYEPFLNRVYKSIKRKLSGEMAKRSEILTMELDEIRTLIASIQERMVDVESELEELNN